MHIVEALRRDAKAWVPRHFPKGRREGNVWRLANIHGAPPRKQGSCVIALEGPNAGDWIDFLTVRDPAGLCPRSNRRPGSRAGNFTPTRRALSAWPLPVPSEAPKSRGNGATPAGIAESRSATDSRSAAIETEIRHILARSVPIKGTLAETHLRSRGLEVPETEDLRFVADLTHFETQTGWPGMVGIVRDSRGEMIGLHRTYLALDGSTKAPLSTPRMSLGHIGGGVVHLAAPNAGSLGLAEGIETALAVMRACPQLPLWAALIEHEQLGVAQDGLGIENEARLVNVLQAQLKRAQPRFLEQAFGDAKRWQLDVDGDLGLSFDLLRLASDTR
jgi:hypothetical protein